MLLALLSKVHVFRRDRDFAGTGVSLVIFQQGFEVLFQF